MANVQFGGLITGLDTKALIAGLVAAESRPITNMTGQKTVLQAKGPFIPLWRGLSAV